MLVLNSCKMSTWNLAFPAMGGSVQPQNQSMAFSLLAPSDPATEKALCRSQGVPLAGIPFLCFPTSRLSRMDSSLFHVLLLCRLWLPLPPSSRFCRCGRPLDPSGHHFGVSSETQRHPAQSLCLEDGVALRQARRRKEGVYPELSGAHGRARLVVLANEVGGRWSLET